MVAIYSAIHHNDHFERALSTTVITETISESSNNIWQLKQFLAATDAYLLVRRLCLLAYSSSLDRPQANIEHYY